MSKKGNFFLLLLLIPTIAETIAASKYSIAIPGSPFTLGRITFILVGIVGIIYNKNFNFKSNSLKGMLLIFIGGLFGGLLSNQIGLSLSRSFGTILLFIGSIGIATLWNKKIFQYFLDIFFIINLSYWTYYVFDLTVLRGSTFLAYSKLFMDKEAINHHVIGINASVSCIYVALRYFYRNEQMQLGGYIIVFIGVITCFLCESRSNLLFTIFALLIIFFISKMKFSKIMLFVIPLMIGMYTLLIGLAEKNESLFQRFNATDSDYQERTTGMRFEFISVFFKTFTNNPFGRGVFGAEIESARFESTMLHNQYLTFILSGGIIALLGIYLWITDFFKLFRFAIKKGKDDKYNFAIIISMLTFLITLTTIEISGLLFFIFTSLLINQSENYVIKSKSLLKINLLRSNE